MNKKYELVFLDECDETHVINLCEEVCNTIRKIFPTEIIFSKYVFRLKSEFVYEIYFEKKRIAKMKININN